MKYNNDIVKELNDFLKGLNMGFEAFENYLHKAKSPKLKNELNDILNIFNGQKDIIVSFIENLKGTVKDSLGIGGELAIFFEKLKEIFMNTDNEIIHNSIKALEMGIKGSENTITSLEKITEDKTMIAAINNVINEYRIIINRLNKLNETL